MSKRIAINLFLVIIFCFINFGFLAFFLPGLNLWLAVFCFLILFFDLPVIIAWLFGLGIFMDLFSLNLFGFYLGVFFLIYLISQYLIRNVFTNQSLNTLIILVAIIVIFFNLATWLAHSFFQLMGIRLFYIFSLNTFFVQLIFNILAAVLFFLVIKFFTKRLRLDILYQE